MRKLADISAPVKKDLRKISLLADKFQTLSNQKAGKAVAAAVNTGGKQLRPLLALLTAGASGHKIDRRFYMLSAALEMLHNSSLIHDDVVDNSRTRRGAKALNGILDNKTAVLAGDFIFTTSLRLFNEWASPSLFDFILRAVSKMTVAEIDQLYTMNDLEMREKDCVDIIIAKTGLLFEAAALLSADPDKDKASYKRFGILGRSIGTLYQLSDDWLDYTGGPEILGKDSLNDLSEGKVTLPLIYMRRSLSASGRRVLDSMIGKKTIKLSDRALIKLLLTKSGAESGIKSIMKKHKSRALSVINTFPDSPSKRSLACLCAYIEERTFPAETPYK